MRKFLNIMFGFVLLTMAIVFIGCESDSIDDGSDYLADNPYESVDHIELTGETAYDLQIIPGTNFIFRNESLQLYVTGGTEPYGSWINARPDLGYVSKSGLYTAGETDAATNTVSITDAMGKTAIAIFVVQ